MGSREALSSCQGLEPYLGCIRLSRGCLEAPGGRWPSGGGQLVRLRHPRWLLRWWRGRLLDGLFNGFTPIADSFSAPRDLCAFDRSGCFGAEPMGNVRSKRVR